MGDRASFSEKVSPIFLSFQCDLPPLKLSKRRGAGRGRGSSTKNNNLKMTEFKVEGVVEVSSLSRAKTSRQGILEGEVSLYC